MKGESRRLLKGGTITAILHFSRRNPPIKEVIMAQSNAARQQSANDERPTSDNAVRKPVDKFHDGSVHVSIWENPGPKGAFRTASFQLRYRDKEQQWQTGHSYTVSDLKHLKAAAQEARTRIENWQQEKRAARDHAPGS